MLGLALVGPVPAAVAHGTELTIQVEPTSIVAGGAVRVTGDLFGADAIVTIGLASDAATISLGDAQAGPDGSLSAVVNIPSALAPGTYEIRVTEAGQMRDAELTVTADPRGGGARPGQDEPFAVPTAVPEPVTRTEAPAASVTPTGAATGNGLGPVLVGAAAVVVLSGLLVALRVGGRWRSRQG